MLTQVRLESGLVYDYVMYTFVDVQLSVEGRNISR